MIPSLDYFSGAQVLIVQKMILVHGTALNAYSLVMLFFQTL